jgi:dipeptidyl aminopeptidase/acylaminoacyl peptidase
VTEVVHFFTEGHRRPAVVEYPRGGASGARLPAVVLAHGLANDREEAGQFVPLTNRLVEEEHVVLRFDFRGGARDAEPGRHMPATEWIHDLLAALAFIRRLDRVDPLRVGVIGASCGGSVALSAAAIDPQLRFVATLGCFGDGARWLHDLWTHARGVDAWEGFVSDLISDRNRRACGLPSRRVPLAGGFLPVPEDDIPALEELLRANPGMLREVALEVADDLLLLSPEQTGVRGTCPVLISHGTDDTLVPLTEADRLTAAFGKRVTRVDFRNGQHQLLLGNQCRETLDVISSWVRRLT